MWKTRIRTHSSAIKCIIIFFHFVLNRSIDRYTNTRVVRAQTLCTVRTKNEKAACNSYRRKLYGPRTRDGTISLRTDRVRDRSKTRHDMHRFHCTRQTTFDNARARVLHDPFSRRFNECSMATRGRGRRVGGYDLLHGRRQIARYGPS